MIAPRLSAVLVTGLPLLYAACGSDNLTLPGEGEPAHIAKVAGDGQTARVGSQLAPLVVRVTDAKDRPVAGALVGFAFDDAAGGSTIHPSSAKTDADGKASATITLGDQVGAVNGHATVTVPQGTTPVQIAFNATASPADASGIQAVSGDGQSGQVGSALGQPLVVKVADQFGNPIPGVTVAWSITGGGRVSESSTQTGPDGQTSVTRVLGDTAGPQTTKASAEALTGSPSVTFTHEATPGNATQLEKVDGDNQSALAGTEVPKPLVVRVLDAQNNPVQGRAVTWVVGTGGGSVDQENTTTNAQGQASTHWTLGPSVGANTVNAVVSGVGTPTVTFTATATAGSISASNSTVRASPGSITAGASTSTITVHVKDANGTDVTGVSVSVSSSGTGNQIDPASANSDQNGVASFTFGSTVAEDKTITAVAGGVTLDQKPTITVQKARSRTRLTGHNPDPSTAGQPVHVTFTVRSDQGGGTPTGQVSIVSDKEASAGCTGTLDASGQGSCDITLNVVDDHKLSALYPGDSRFDVSNDDDNHRVTPGVSQAPIANPDAYTTLGGGLPLGVPAPGVLANDTGAGPLTAQLASPPTQGGALTFNPDGSFTYTPLPGATGQDSFTYTASDGTLTSAPATVTINITP